MHRGVKIKVIIQNRVENFNHFALQVCHAGRSGLGQASREFTASSLGILSAYRRRQQAKRLLNDLNIIRTLVSQTGAKCGKPFWDELTLKFDHVFLLTLEIVNGQSENSLNLVRQRGVEECSGNLGPNFFVFSM